MTLDSNEQTLKMQSFYSNSLHTQQISRPIQRVLGIETSCDETAIALYDANQGLLADSLYSQVTLHDQYGGVVPELASREHILKILPLLKKTLSSLEYPFSALEGIAYCAGPGLSGALLVGATFGRSLAWALNIPALGVHHLEAHLFAVMLEKNPPQFPFLALLVSGGHTLLAHIKALGNYEVLGESLDDAAGEAFDKTAKLLGLVYPGGPSIAQLAKNGRPNRYHFPRPMTKRPHCHFSFSGLKTSVSHLVKTSDQSEQTKADIAYAFQSAVVDTLVIKTTHALNQTGLKRLVIGGGVAANTHLRNRLAALAQKKDLSLYYPRPNFCTDNAAMIAYLGFRRFNLGQNDNNLAIKTISRFPLDRL